jgi:hypothetical protein
LSDRDTAAAGGWRDVGTLVNVYQNSDDETMEAVVLHPKRLKMMG